MDKAGLLRFIGTIDALGFQGFTPLDPVPHTPDRHTAWSLVSHHWKDPSVIPEDALANPPTYHGIKMSADGKFNRLVWLPTSLEGYKSGGKLVEFVTKRAQEQQQAKTGTGA
jgi:hypothetical protein